MKRKRRSYVDFSWSKRDDVITFWVMLVILALTSVTTALTKSGIYLGATLWNGCSLIHVLRSKKS
jgi:hypothetical protein